jgi:hypothetical protein
VRDVKRRKECMEQGRLDVASVTDGEKGECVDPGENGAILGAGGDEGPGPPGRGKSG